jgi:invasion protein IalB
MAQQKEAAPKPPQSWTVNCASGANGELACALSQVMVVKDSGQRVLTVSVMKDAGAFAMRLSLPHGLDLPKGVDVWVDEAPRRNNPIVTADKSGSYAVIKLTDAMIAELKQGTQLNVAVTAYAGKEIVLQLSLAGFTAGFAKL